MVDDRRISEEKTMKMLTRSALALIAALAAMMAFAAGSAQAVEPGFTIFKVTPSSTKAGGHPDVSIDLNYAQTTESEEEGGAESLFARTVTIHFPEGFIGNPHVAPKCTLTEFNQSSCPVDAQIGRFSLVGLGGEKRKLYVPLYNMETNPEQAGLLGFAAPFLNFPIFFELSGRTNSDYGLDAKTTPTIRLPFSHFETTLWGVPADPIHNVDRFQSPLTGLGACDEGGSPTKGCPPGVPFYSLTYAEPTAPERPFLQNPTTCGVDLTTTGDVEYYGGTTAHVEREYPNTTSCQQASFSPSLFAKATTTETDTASGLDTDLLVPQTQSPHTQSPSELRETTITLPPGFTINPNAADGKLACPEALNAIGTLFAAHCPEYSKIGSLVLDVAALPAPLPGAMYLLEPKPGQRFRVLIAADGFATHVKLVGVVKPDPQNGRITISFEHLPQAPLQEFNVHLFGSERGLFASPTKCGTFPVLTKFVPWNNTLTTRQLESTMTFTSGPGGPQTPCPGPQRPFGPSLRSGSENSTGGLHAPFTLIVNRSDGEQNLTGIDVTTPPGFAATLKGIPYCPESALAQLSDPSYSGLAEEASSACPAASQIGTAVAGVGAGTHPLYVGGKVYLAGPYKGAPLSLEAVLPAVSGPYDLGVVAIRSAIHVDPATAQVTATSDPLPQIIEGVPLRTRYIRLNLDRPGFTLNPTSCEPFSVNGTLLGDEGATASPSNAYQATNCTDLAYAPHLSLKLTGGFNRRGHPALHAVYTQQPGEANSHVVQVALPRAELLDNAHIGTVCTRVQFAAEACPAGSLIGHAMAETPLLDRPLEGNVYLRSSSHELPDVVADLKGQFEIELDGRIDTPKGSGMRTTFASVPDAPVTKFVLDLQGGKQGLLVNSENLCRSNRKAAVEMVGQNGEALNTETKLQAACGSKARHNRLHRRRHKRHYLPKAGH